MLITFILLIVTTGFAIYFGTRIWFLAGKLADAQEYIEELELTNEYMYSRIVASVDAMQEIDRIGAFEKDDEAGTTFQLLNQVVTELKEQFDVETQEEK